MRAGTPRISVLSGNTFPSVINAPAPMMQFLPILATLRIVADIPTRVFSPIVHPWSVAWWPTVHPAPIDSGNPLSA